MITEAEKTFLKELKKLTDKYNISIESSSDDYGNTDYYFRGKDIDIPVYEVERLMVLVKSNKVVWRN